VLASVTETLRLSCANRSLAHHSEMPRIIAHAVKLLSLSINVARRENDGCLKVGWKPTAPTASPFATIDPSASCFN